MSKKTSIKIATWLGNGIVTIMIIFIVMVVIVQVPRGDTSIGEAALMLAMAGAFFLYRPILIRQIYNTYFRRIHD